MRWLREKLGPDVLTFCEQQADAILPLSGGYSETTLHAEPKDQPAHYRLWSGSREWEIYQWLVPGAQLASRHYQTTGKPPADIEPACRWFYRNRVTPLVPVGSFEAAGRLRQWQGEFLSDPGRWKSE
jgi:hypothetical protein